MSAEALMLTFVNLADVADTITCVSTVSPRAPEILTEEAVPGGSVGPTLTRLGSTHAVSGAEVALTLSVAALLVTLPAELLTTTVNCAALSEVVVAVLV
jgi:hypothetical protein